MTTRVNVDRKTKYLSIFNTKTGFYINNPTSETPFLSPVGPELLDISITNKCNRSCDFCYMSSSPTGNEFLKLTDLKLVLDQAKSVFQIAYGGGEPTLHPKFDKILRMTRKYGIVPNLTTNGMNLTNPILYAMKDYCGAVAVSVYDMDTAFGAAEKMISMGIKTNWHWIINNRTLPEITRTLQNGSVPKGLNAIIFLMHKPIGRGSSDDQVTSLPKLACFFKLVRKSELTIGFDACSMEWILRYHSDTINPAFIDSCDAARYTCYLDWNLNVSPCSFGRERQDTFSLRKFSLNEIWFKKFEPYRRRLQNSVCKGKCTKFKSCYSGCPILPINLCAERNANASIAA